MIRHDAHTTTVDGAAGFADKHGERWGTPWWETDERIGDADVAPMGLPMPAEVADALARSREVLRGLSGGAA